MTRVRKELIELAPLWGLGLVLCLAPLLVPPSDGMASLLLAGYAVGCALLSVAIFGKELAGGTLGMLLVQPIPRSRLLLEKAAPAILGSILLSALWGALCLGRGGWAGERGFFFASLVLVPFCCIGPGVFLTLWLRQANGAFWISLLLPAFLISLVDLAWDGLHLPPRMQPASVMLLLVLYGSAGTWLAWRQLASLQELESQALSWSFGQGLSDETRVVATGRAIRALVRKEFRLQTLNLGLAGLLLVGYAFFALVGNHDWPGKDLVMFSWLLLPFSIGVIPIAWERRLGIMEWQQTQPISRFTQWVVKASVVGFLSLAVGIVFLAGFYGEWTTFSAAGDRVLFFLGISGLILLGPAIGLFASSRTSSYLVGLSLAAGVAVGFILGFLLLVRLLGFLPPTEPHYVVAVVGLVWSLIMLCWLSWRNYSAIHLSRRLTWMNLQAGLFLVGGWFTSAYLLYHQPLQSWLRAEPPPGPSIVQAGVTPVIRPGVGAIAPDGRLWLNDRGTFVSLLVQGEPMWSTLVTGWRQAVALKRDHTLWAVPQRSTPRAILPGYRWSRVIQRGTNWLGLTTEGALWQWNGWDPLETELEEPAVGKGRRWKDIAYLGWAYFGIETNGACWAWSGAAGHSPYVQLSKPVPVNPDRRWSRFVSQEDSSWGVLESDGGDLFVAHRRLGEEGYEVSLRWMGQRGRWRSWAVDSYTGSTIAAIRDDGTLWERNSRSLFGGWYDAPEDIFAQHNFNQISDRSDWVAVAAFGSSLFGLTADGSFWQWGSPDFGNNRDRWIPFSRIPRITAKLK